MAIFHVDSDQVSLAAATADQSAAAIRAEVTNMMVFLQGLAESWGGAASSQFQGVIHQWQATQIQVEDSLSLISNQLNQAAVTYTEAETTAASFFAG